MLIRVLLFIDFLSPYFLPFRLLRQAPGPKRKVQNEVKVIETNYVGNLNFVDFTLSAVNLFCFLLFLLKLIISIAVPLGSIRELPVESCKEIKASGGGKAVSSDNYWMDSTRSGNSILARCDMKTEGLYKTWFVAFFCRTNDMTFLNRLSLSLVADYCVKHQCQNDAKCVNCETNYTCACNSSGRTGKYCEKGSSFVKIISHF